MDGITLFLVWDRYSMVGGCDRICHRYDAIRCTSVVGGLVHKDIYLSLVMQKLQRASCRLPLHETQKFVH